MPGEEEDLNRPRVTKRLAEATPGAGVLVVDATGVPTPGPVSVGVARPAAGTRGQVGNGQGAVTGCDADPQAAWPVAVRWYLPPAWAQDPARRPQARVPAAVAVQTRPEIARVLLDHARAWGVPPCGVVAEADEGDTPHVLAGVEARQAPSVGAVRTDCPVRRGPTASPPGWRADAWLPSVPRWPWRTRRWRRGTQGWRRQQCGAGRC